MDPREGRKLVRARRNQLVTFPLPYARNRACETLDRWRSDAPSPMERVRTLDPAPDQRQIRDTYRRAGILLPALQRAPITAAWAGYIDSTPDGISAISEVQGLPGLPGVAIRCGDAWREASGPGVWLPAQEWVLPDVAEGA